MTNFSSLVFLTLFWAMASAEGSKSSSADLGMREFRVGVNSSALDLRNVK